MIATNSFLISPNKGAPLLCDITALSDDALADDLVVFCHGYKGYKDWGCWNLVAKRFAQEGISFLKFNFSGNGTTPEHPTEFVDEDAFKNNTYTKELEEAKQVVTWVTENRESLNLSPNARIHLIGHSRGGGIAFLGAEEHPSVFSSSLWAAISDFENRFPFGFELKAWRDNGLLAVENARTGQVLHHSYEWFEDYHRNKRRLYIRPIAKTCSRPMFVAHAMDDLAVHVSAGMKYNKWCQHSELLLLEEGGHTFGSKEPWELDALPAPLEKVCAANIRFIQSIKKA